MERIKRTFKKLTIKKSFALLILLFLLLDIFLCLATAGLLQLLPGKYYALSSPLIVCLYSALCLASAACLFYKCKLEEPVRLIKEAAARIGRQDLDFRLSYDSNDEMGELCRSVESMRLALEDNYRLLWSQAEEKKRINAAFAHDMRTPLTIIKGYLEFQELSAGSLSPKDLQKQAAVMKKHLARMENYIEAMNSLATPDGIRPSLPSSAPESWRRNSSVQPPCSASGFTSPLSRNRSFPDLPCPPIPKSSPVFWTISSAMPPHTPPAPSLYGSP